MAGSVALAFDILAKDRASATLAKVGQEAEKTHGHFGQLAKVGAAALAGLGIAAAAFGKKSIDTFQEAGKQTIQLQRLMGGSAEAASQLRFAAKETGVGFDALAAGVTKFEKTTVQAGGQFSEFEAKVKDAAAHHKVFAGHLGANATAFTKLGISVKDAQGELLPMSAVLPQVADQFKSMPNGAEKTALAMQLFGKQGTALIPFLNKGADGLAELAKQSDRLGDTMSGKDLDAIKQNTKAHKQWHAAMEGLQMQVGRLLMPVLADLATFAASTLVPVVTRISDAVVTKLGPAFSWASDVIRGFSDGFRGLSTGGSMGGFAGDVERFGVRVKTVFETAKQDLGSFLTGFRGAQAGTRTTHSDSDVAPKADKFTSFGAQAKAAFDSVVAAVQDHLIPSLKTLGQTALDLGSSVARKLFPVLVSLGGVLLDMSGTLIPLSVAFLAVNAAVSAGTGIINTAKDGYELVQGAMAALTVAKGFFIATTNAETGAVTASGLSMLGARIASAAATVQIYALIVAENIAAAASKAWAGAQWLLNAALDANPIGLIVIGVAALAAGFVYAYQHSETFRKIVTEAFGAVLKVISFYLDMYGNMLGALGHVPGFGWAKDAAGALHSAANAANGLADSINAVPRHVDIGVNFKAYGADALGVATNAAKHGRATGGPVSAGTPYLVGENEPELFVPTQSGTILNGRQMGRMGGGGGGDTHVHVTVQGNVLDGRQLGDLVQTALLQKKNRTGALGLA